MDRSAVSVGAGHLRAEENANREVGGEIVVYEAADGGVRVEVVVGDETVWLTQRQMADLFETSTDNVGLHIKNAYAEGELEEGATTEDSSVVRSEGGRQVRRRIQHYNLDVIISVGYRVKSRRGTQFRIWATNTLRDHLIRGYTLNEKRLRDRGVEIEQAVALLSSTLRNQQLITDEGQAVLEVVQRYARSWRMLRAYDEDQLSSAPDGTAVPLASLDIGSARTTIRTLRDDTIARGENPGMFGQERGGSSVTACQWPGPGEPGAGAGEATCVDRRHGVPYHSIRDGERRLFRGAPGVMIASSPFAARRAAARACPVGLISSQRSAVRHSRELIGVVDLYASADQNPVYKDPRCGLSGPLFGPRGATSSLPVFFAARPYG